jgi:crossover junction endodeoxyribonuclease RuvC
LTPQPREPAERPAGPLRVMGIDPGLADLGWGILQRDPRTHRIEHLEHGVIRTRAGVPVARRLQAIYCTLTELIERFHPDEVAVEELFFASNVSTAITVAQARGVAILASAQSGVPLGEYSPPQIKQAVTGSGKADKAQVQRMVRAVLHLDEIPQPDHAADALAVALCHLHHAGMIVQARQQQLAAKAEDAPSVNKQLLAQQRRRRR